MTATPRAPSPAARLGSSLNTSIGPMGPCTISRSVWAFMSAPQVGRGQQPLDHTPVLEVGLDNFINVGCVHIGIPDGLRVDHGHGPGGAAIQATSLVHAHLAGAGTTLVEAEKDVTLVIRGGRGSRGSCPGRFRGVVHAPILVFHARCPTR